MATMSTMTSNGEVNSPSQLPAFVFPARAPASAPAPIPKATSRRPMSIPAELPSFSFNSTTSLVGESAYASPPLSPLSPLSDKSIPSRAAGHRRGTSEFIGGDGKTGSIGLMSTSPTKGDNILPPPNAPRRGHVHRRSQAVSVHDLQMILNPNNLNTPAPRGGSAPTSPSGQEHLTGILDSFSHPKESSDDIAPLKALGRARVGFSDNIEFIPRPLSLVSSDTSSTMTMRQSHSVSGSLSSIVSAGASSPPEKDQRGLVSPSPSLKSFDSRPRTAGAVLDAPKESPRMMDELSCPKRRGSVPILDDISISIPSSPKKKWSFFGNDSSAGDQSPNRSRPVSSVSEKGTEAFPSVSAPPTVLTEIVDPPMPSIEPSSSRRSSVSRKSSKKQKKVKSWAGSILSRKSRPRNQKKKSVSRRSPTPPLRPYLAMDSAAVMESGQLEVNSEHMSPPKPELQTDFASWKPRHVPPQDDDSMSPIIDLDAALGPFNTPSTYDAEWDASQRGSSSKRRMHSAAGMGGFMGPGMHYHRRAESAPEMVAFENPRFGLHRLGSSSTMADVFEEDEEDEWEDTKASDKESVNKADDDEQGLGIDIKVVDAENMNADKTMDWTADESSSLQRGLKRKGSGLSDGEHRHASSSMKSEHSVTSLKDEPILEESHSLIEIYDDTLPPRPDSEAQSSDSTATPPLRPRPGKVEIHPLSLQAPFLTPTSPHSTTHSSFPSPRSPYSYDAHRISTAPSSVTDENAFQSLLLGEPGPEIRMSVDDVPSLTSSNSTMTRESGPQPSPSFQFRDGHRSASLSSAAVTRKRSSMASLSRLISSSHGEKSKLSIETRPSTMEGDKKDKKSKRFSRMIQFWKPKESA